MRKLLIYLPIILFLTAIGGCRSAELKREDALAMANAVLYTKDMRTGLCFATSQYGIGQSWVVLFTNVPCEAIPSSLLTLKR